MWTDVPDGYGTVFVPTGGEVRLLCHVQPSADTNVKWLHTEHVDFGPPLNYSIYVNGQIKKHKCRRCSIFSAIAGDYDLKIVKVREVDAGHYRCFNNDQLIKTYLIYVTGEF